MTVLIGRALDRLDWGLRGRTLVLGITLADDGILRAGRRSFPLAVRVLRAFVTALGGFLADKVDARTQAVAASVGVNSTVVVVRTLDRLDGSRGGTLLLSVALAVLGVLRTCGCDFAITITIDRALIVVFGGPLADEVDART